MTDLTEQWQKGELPDRLYYVKYPDRVEVNTKGHLEIYLEYAKNNYKNKMEVLAEVPTYEEYQALLKDKELWIKRCNNARKHQFNAMKDAKTLAQKLLQIKPELREWLEVNYKEYL